MGLPDMGLPDDIQSEELFFHLRAKGNEIGNEWPVELTSRT